MDEDGCRIDQRVYGSIEKTERSHIRFLEIIIAPVTNLLQAASGKDCEVYYDGRVSAPKK